MELSPAIFPLLLKHVIYVFLNAGVSVCVSVCVLVPQQFAYVGRTQVAAFLFSISHA